MGEVNPICVVPLGERPDTIPVIAAWLYEQWGYFHDQDSVERRIAELSERLQTDTIPVAFVALASYEAGAEPIGTASLTPDDLETRPDLTPWLASVLVRPEHRGGGVGAALVRAVVAHARKLGVETLYLFTEDQVEFYKRLGWQVIGPEILRGHPIVVMNIRP